MATTAYRFLSHEGDLMRAPAEDLLPRTEVLWPTGDWARYQLDPFTDSYTEIPRWWARATAGSGVDLDALPLPLANGAPVAVAGAHVRARDAAAS
jgi:hypothetical protein